MNGEDDAGGAFAALLSLLDGFKPLRCEGCVGLELDKRPMIEPVLGDVPMHGFHQPAAVYEHGRADDNRPHWRLEIPIRRKG